MFDLDALRRATPGCSKVAHLNNAGASLPTTRTLSAMIDHLHLEADMGGYEAAAAVDDRHQAVRNSVAAMIGSGADEVALSTSDTAAFAKAFWGYLHGIRPKPGGVVVVDRLSYVSHRFPVLQARDLFGLEIAELPADHSGVSTGEGVEELIARRPLLVSLTMVPTHTGAMNDIASIAEPFRAAGIPVFVDACQAVGQMPVAVDDLHCDVLTANGRKFLRGPRGTGFLYVRSGLAEQMSPPAIDGHSAAWPAWDRLEFSPGSGRFEEFEVSLATRLGLGAAIDQALEIGLETIAERALGLAERLRSELAGRPGVMVRDGDGRRSAITTFTIDGWDPSEIVALVSAGGVNINAATPPPGVEQPVRVSPHYYNTDDELDRLLDLLPAAR